MNHFTLPDGTRVYQIGDPHLGRKFETGVPLHRRGEREASQIIHFNSELSTRADVIVMVGDLFDNPYVGYGVTQIAARAVMAHAAQRPDTLFIMMAGNHDKPRNIEAVGAFDSFREQVAGRYPNIIVAMKPMVVRRIALFPWEWGVRADEQAQGITMPYDVAIGHWDLSVFEGKDDHLAPVDDLLPDVPLYSGHYHKPGVYRVGGRDVNCIGSMEPYTHAEDATGELYVTLSRAEALLRDDLYGKNVRIILEPGDDMPVIDCLSLTHIKAAAVLDEGEGQTTVSLATFDWNKIRRDRIATLHPEVQAFIAERITIDGGHEH